MLVRSRPVQECIFANVVGVAETWLVVQVENTEHKIRAVAIARPPRRDELRRLVESRARSSRATLLVAEQLSEEALDDLDRGQVGYVITDGPLRLDLPGLRLVGVPWTSEAEPAPRRSPRPRGPGLRVDLTLLCNPELLGAGRRYLAHLVGTSVSPVDDRLRALREAGLVRARGMGLAWAPDGRRALLASLATSYWSVLRPSLAPERYRLPEHDPAAMERRVRALLGGMPGRACLAGASVAAPHCRREGPLPVVLCLDEELRQEAVEELGATPDSQGPLELLTLPTKAAVDPIDARHGAPLLNLLELLAPGREDLHTIASEYQRLWVELHDLPLPTSRAPADARV